jgi:hypothetical protein
MDSLIGRQISELSETQSTPEVEPRSRIAPIFPDEKIRSTREAVHDHPTDFVFNLAEIEISERDVRENKKARVAAM